MRSCFRTCTRITLWICVAPHIVVRWNPNRWDVGRTSVHGPADTADRIAIAYGWTPIGMPFLSSSTASPHTHRDRPV